MAATSFGFFVGDFVRGTQVLVQVLGAFKEKGGASSKYASEIAFLTGLNSTLQHLENYTSNTQENDLSQDILKINKVIRGPLDDFKDLLDKYQASLGASSSKSIVSKAPKTIRYTFKDLSGKVETLRRQIGEPLQAVNSLLSLHIIKSLETLPDQLLQPTQCAQLVEAIRLADVPSELDKQIRVLQRTASEHNIKQDEQLQIISKLRSQLDEKTSSLSSAISQFKNDVTANTATNDEQESQSKVLNEVQTSINKLSAALETRTEKLEKAMKEQLRLIVALKSFLEDKAASAEASMVSDDDLDQSRAKQISGVTWPSATLSTAYLAVMLLSSVVSSVAAANITATKATTNRISLNPAHQTSQQRVFYTTKQYINGTSSSSSQPTSSTPTTAEGTRSSTQQETKKPVETAASRWVSEWTISQDSAQNQKLPPTSGGVTFPAGGGGGGGGGNNMSKLSEPDAEDSNGQVGHGGSGSGSNGGYPGASSGGAVSDDSSDDSDSSSAGGGGGGAYDDSSCDDSDSS